MFEYGFIEVFRMLNFVFGFFEIFGEVILALCAVGDLSFFLGFCGVCVGFDKEFKDFLVSIVVLGVEEFLFGEIVVNVVIFFLIFMDV